MKIYSNEKNINLISSMIHKSRVPHSIAICGEKGQGKKTLAKFIASQLLCEKNNGESCGSCKACRMIENDCHPDFITVQSNENGNYQVDRIREIVSDAVVKPNESDYKIYLIPDLDRSTITSVQVQNILLKLIEEPPAHCIVILTAATKQIFLQTIISRVLCLTVEPCTSDQSKEWLRQKGLYDEVQIASAVECGHGNLGRCSEFLEGDILPVAYDISRKCIDAIIDNDEYNILFSLFKADGKKPLFRQVLVFLSEISRDACIARLGIFNFAGCYHAGAKKLSAILHENITSQLYELFCDYIKRIDSNCNLTLAMNSLAGEICGLINRP